MSQLTEHDHAEETLDDDAERTDDAATAAEGQELVVEELLVEELLVEEVSIDGMCGVY